MTGTIDLMTADASVAETEPRNPPHNRRSTDRQLDTLEARSAPRVLTFVIPTRNEAAGVEELLNRISAAVTVPAEVLFVDDSDDTTPYAVQRLVEENGWGDLEIRLVHRTEAERVGGLGTAACEGIRRARGEWVVVMDADLQHPPEMVPEMLKQAINSDSDVVVASRYAEGGRDEGLSPSRRAVSRTCATAAKVSFPKRLQGVSDPLSGFFMLRRSAIKPDILRPNGFKILMEILGRHPNLRVTEVGFTFSKRYAGMSKASLKEGGRYFRQLAELRGGAWAQRKDHNDGTFNYNVHGIVTVRSSHLLPELAKFRVRHLEGPPTVKVSLRRFDRQNSGELIDLEDATPSIRYGELGQRGFVVQVEVGDETTNARVSRLVANSPHVLYTNVVEAILRWRFVEAGYALVHAACFVKDGEAHLVTARTDTGKTTTMLKVLEQDNYEYVSDDLTIISADGTVLSYPKPMTISHHTVHALQSAELSRMQRLTLPLQSRLHSKDGREFAFMLAEKGYPVASLNATIQRLIPPPKYHVDKLVPGANTAIRAKVRTLNIIQRGDEDSERDLPHDEAIDILLENCEDAYGFPPYPSLEGLMLTASGEDLRSKERQIIKDALANAPTKLYTSNSLGWATDIHERVQGLSAPANSSEG